MSHEEIRRSKGKGDCLFHYFFTSLTWCLKALLKAFVLESWWVVIPRKHHTEPKLVELDKLTRYLTAAKFNLWADQHSIHAYIHAFCPGNSNLLCDRSKTLRAYEEFNKSSKQGCRCMSPCAHNDFTLRQYLPFVCACPRHPSCHNGRLAPSGR